jgi:hypothetical protein
MAASAAATAVSSTDIVPYLPKTDLPSTFKVEGTHKLRNVSWGDLVVRYSPKIYRLSIAEANSKTIPNVKKHCGQLYIPEVMLEEEDCFFDELYLIPVAQFTATKSLRFAPYNPNGDNKADCYSFDGIVPSESSPNIQSDNCADCAQGQKAWKTYKKTGEKPKCIETQPVVFFDVDHQIFIEYRFKSTGMTAFRDIRKKIDTKQTTAFLQGLELKNYVVVMRTKEETNYYKLDLEYKPVPDKNPDRFNPLIQWFITEELPAFAYKTKEEASGTGGTTGAAGEEGAKEWFDASGAAGADDIPF